MWPCVWVVVPLVAPGNVSYSKVLASAGSRDGNWGEGSRATREGIVMSPGVM